MIATMNLTLQAGAKSLVNALNWQVSPGECWCVIGRNGVGKTTLLHTLAGVRMPENGVIQLAGRVLWDWTPIELARHRALLPQKRSDAFGFCVLETVLAARHPYHAGASWESKEDHQSAMTALQAMDAADLAGRDVRTLSGGERQRVALAALLSQDAPIMLLDEPTNALDMAHQAGVMQLLSRLCREQGKTIVMVSHDLNLVHDVATHALLLMGEGEWQTGRVDAVMNESLLSRCLGHPVEQVEHEGRTLFVPSVKKAGPA